MLGADPSGFDGPSQALINSQVDAAIAPASPAGIIGANDERRPRRVDVRRPGNNTFYATGPGAYEMIGGNWVNTFSISPSYNGVPATYQIDGGGGDSKLIVRVPSDEHVTFQNSTVVDKYDPTLKALDVLANAGVSATAHGIQKVHIVAASGSHVVIGDTSEVNIDFSIEGGAHLVFGGTNAPDLFDVTSTGPFYGMKNHFSVPKFGFINSSYIGLTGMGVLLPTNNPDPIYYVTRTFGTNGRTQTIPFSVSDADASSIGLDAAGASDTYNLTLGLGAFIDVSVEDSDLANQNALTVNVRDSVLIDNQIVLNDNALHLDYYTRVVFLDAIPVGGQFQDEFFGFSSSVHYTPSVLFGANDNVTFASALPFFQTTVNRPIAPQVATILTDGLYTTTSFGPYSFGPVDEIFDATLPSPQPIVTNTITNNLDVQANAGSFTYNRPTGIRALTVNIESNTGTLGINTSWFGYTDDINVLGNAGTLNVNSAVNGSPGIPINLTHRVNILANTGTINLYDFIISSLSAGVVDAQVNVGTDSAGGVRSLANVHGAINLSGQNGNYGLNIDDRNDSGTTRDWTIDSTHTQVGDVSINYAGLYDGRFADFFSQYAAFWKNGAHVTYRDELPFFNVNMNGSTVYPFFPLAWFPPTDNQFNDGDPVNLALADYFAPAPSGSITYAATNLPPWLSLNTTTGLISGTVPVQAHLDSPFQTLVSASDGTYTRQQDNWLDHQQSHSNLCSISESASPRRNGEHEFGPDSGLQSFEPTGHGKRHRTAARTCAGCQHGNYQRCGPGRHIGPRSLSSQRACRRWN